MGLLFSLGGCLAASLSATSAVAEASPGLTNSFAARDNSPRLININAAL